MKLLRLKKRRKGEAGQGLIEFLLTMCIILTLLFVFVELSWALAWGHYVHYATYMASRAFMAANSTNEDQVDKAANVLRSMLFSGGGQDMLGFVAKSRKGDARDIASGPEDVPGAFIGTHPTAQGLDTIRAYAWAEGVQYNFDVPLYVLPLARWVDKDKGKTVRIGDADQASSESWRGAIPFTSDSWLGRERSTRECQEDMERLERNSGISRQDSLGFIEDNGC